VTIGHARVWSSVSTSLSWAGRLGAGFAERRVIQQGFAAMTIFLNLNRTFGPVDEVRWLTLTDFRYWAG